MHAVSGTRLSVRPTHVLGRARRADAFWGLKPDSLLRIEVKRPTTPTQGGQTLLERGKQGMIDDGSI